MSIFIRNARILTLQKGSDGQTMNGDILVEGDRIAAIGSQLPIPDGARVIDGADRLVMPGLVNAHLHSNEALFRGRYDNMPLEIWMLYAYPILQPAQVPLRLLYLRSMLVAIEALKSGVTSIVDDVTDRSQDTVEKMEAVVSAYDDIGIRATVSSNVMDRGFLDTVPFTRDIVPPELWAEAEREPRPTIDGYVGFLRTLHERIHGRSGRLRLMVAPSAPQRCTPELMQACKALAKEWQVPFHTHILETKVQGVTGQEFYGRTLIQYMADLGLLDRTTTIAHSIWVTDKDIELMAEAGASIVHNVISNQKLGAGVAPMRKLLDAGVNVALGSDGVSTSDNPRMFDVMQACGLVHKIMTPDYTRWISAGEVIDAATRGGAHSAMLEQEIGSIEIGKKADLIVLDMRTVAFTPLNDIRKHLVYSENGGSIRQVIVNGEIVVEDGRLTKVDEDALLQELREAIPEYIRDHERAEALNRRFEAYFARIYQKANERDIGLNRVGNEPAW